MEIRCVEIKPNMKFSPKENGWFLIQNQTLKNGNTIAVLARGKDYEEHKKIVEQWKNKELRELRAIARRLRDVRDSQEENE